jgi:hypothetical protein
MSLTLSAVDNGSMSITATLSTASPAFNPGDVTTVLASKWDGCAGPQVWNAIGTITAPATALTVTMASYGAYHLIATTPAACGPASNPFYLPVVNASLSLFSQCEAAIVSTIQNLNLLGDGGEIGDIGNSVYGQLVPHDLMITIGYPAVFVVSEDGLEKLDEALAGTNLMSNVGNPFKVIIALKANVNQDLIRPILSGWRQTIRRAFDKVRLAGVPSAPWCQAEFGPRFQKFVYRDDGGANVAYETIGSVLTVRVSTREPRGFLAG